jgi:hypothetical protein
MDTYLHLGWVSELAGSREGQETGEQATSPVLPPSRPSPFLPPFFHPRASMSNQRNAIQPLQMMSEDFIERFLDLHYPLPPSSSSFAPSCQPHQIHSIPSFLLPAFQPFPRSNMTSVSPSPSSASLAPSLPMTDDGMGGMDPTSARATNQLLTSHLGSTKKASRGSVGKRRSFADDSQYVILFDASGSRERISMASSTADLIGLESFPGSLHASITSTPSPPAQSLQPTQANPTSPLIIIPIFTTLNRLILTSLPLPTQASITPILTIPVRRHTKKEDRLTINIPRRTCIEATLRHLSTVLSSNTQNPLTLDHILRTKSIRTSPTSTKRPLSPRHQTFTLNRITSIQRPHQLLPKTSILLPVPPPNTPRSLPRPLSRLPTPEGRRRRQSQRPKQRRRRTPLRPPERTRRSRRTGKLGSSDSVLRVAGGRRSNRNRRLLSNSSNTQPRSNLLP